MKLEFPQLAPVDYLAYDLVAMGGRDEHGNRQIERQDLPIYFGELRSTKFTSLDYLIITSDLQGTVTENEQARLLGEALAEYLDLYFEWKSPQIDRSRIGVLLCGDLFALPDKRGGNGDVRQVWRAFQRYFGFVAGVAGNHDSFGDKSEHEAFSREMGIHYLDGHIRRIKDLKVGGLGGIIGNPEKPFRDEETSHLRKLKRLLLQQPDFLLLHEGPNSDSPSLAGSQSIKQLIESSPRNIICCGHNHWDTPFVTLSNGSQILNVDARCVILKAGAP